MDRARSVQDADIQGEAIRAIARDARVKQAGKLHVVTESGVVRLSGDVDSAEEKRAAEAAVRRIRGVAKVENDLTVVIPGKEEDEQLEEQAQQAIAEDPRLGSLDVGAEVDDGIVHVVGHVETAAEEDRAERLTGGVHGMKDVVSDLKVGDVYLEDDEVVEIVDDAVLKGEVVKAILTAGIPLLDEDIEVDEGVVHLRGRVTSRDEANRAARLATEVPGVQSVDDELVVDPAGGGPTRRPVAEQRARPEGGHPKRRASEDEAGLEEKTVAKKHIENAAGAAAHWREGEGHRKRADA